MFFGEQEAKKARGFESYRDCKDKAFS